MIYIYFYAIIYNVSKFLIKLIIINSRIYHNLRHSIISNCKIVCVNPSKGTFEGLHNVLIRSCIVTIEDVNPATAHRRLYVKQCTAVHNEGWLPDNTKTLVVLNVYCSSHDNHLSSTYHSRVPIHSANRLLLFKHSISNQSKLIRDLGIWWQMLQQSFSKLFTMSVFIHCSDDKNNY